MLRGELRALFFDNCTDYALQFVVFLNTSRFCMCRTGILPVSDVLAVCVCTFPSQETRKEHKRFVLKVVST